MSVVDFRKPSMHVGRREGPPPGHHPRYALIVDARGVCLSAHVPYDQPGVLMVAGFNHRGDYRPARLTPEQARGLRDAIDLYLADDQSA